MAFIDRNFINDLSQQVDIVALIHRRVPLKKGGKDYKACCPFHHEKTPSFSVVPSKQMYHCFGCNESGGAIDFVMKFDHLDFKEAVETVAGESGINVVYDKNAKLADPRIKRYGELMQQVSEFYQQQLKHSAAKQKVVNYAKKRGITGASAKVFELGFAPPGWSNLFDFFKGNLEAIVNLAKMGLLVAKKDKPDQYYDRFRDRLMFPIHNQKGEVIAFGGRVLEPDEQPKYLNSPETPIFSKSKTLYGLYHCRKYARSIDYVLVVEGYMDVVALHQNGIYCVVAALGTALTPAHLQLLLRTTNTIVFCFDGDKAGRAAAWRALCTILPMIKAGLVVRFLFLPDGEDPDTLIQKESTQAFEKRIQTARTLSHFLFKHIRSEVDFDTIEGKTAFLEKALVLIKTINYELYQRQLIQGAAQYLGQSVEQIERAVYQQKSTSNAPTFEVAADFAPSNFAPPELAPPDFADDFHLSNFAPDNFAPVETFENPAAHTLDVRAKALMSRLITLLLNYPALANDDVEKQVRAIEQSKVLLELVHTAQLNPEISAAQFIQPFAHNTAIYQRLQQLCTLAPYLNEAQATEEFVHTLGVIERQKNTAEVRVSMRQAHTPEQELRAMEAIQKIKRKS